MKKFLSKAMMAVMVVSLLAPAAPVQAKEIPANGIAVSQQSEAKTTAAELRTALEAAKKDTAKKKTAMYAAHRAATEANEKEKQGSYGFFKEYGYTNACKVLESTNSAITSYTKIGQASDSTSLSNLKATIPFLKEANSLRASEGVDPQATSSKLGSLKVSMYLMAVSEVQTNWSSYNMGHSRMYNVAENIAWGYSDPFAGWYSEERALWQNGTRDFSSVGHYLNLCNSEYEITGFAVNQYSGYRVTHGQTFLWSGSGKEVMTVAQFEAKLNAYCKSLRDARTAYKNAKAAYEQALAYENQLQAQLNALPTISGLKVTALSYRRIRVNYKASANAVGYQIRYATSEKMTGAKSVYTRNTNQVITGLKAGKVYYVQVRAYSRDSAGKAVYGNWSQKKKIKAFQ